SLIRFSPPRFLCFFALSKVFKEAEAEAVGLRKLRRQKREWIIPPKHLKENYDYKDTIIAKIRSDEETRSSIRYSLTGEGVSEGLFVVDAKKGFVRVTRKLDREKKSFYSLKGIAEFENGTKAEKDIDLRIFVDDENDCRPQFVIIPVGFVNESSPSGTFVIMVNATDDDDPKTQNAKIAYKIIEQQPGGNLMFHINWETGAIYVNLPTLDREVQDKYTLIVEARDLDGDQKGNAVTATVTFNVLDINDNIPQLENSSYEGSVEENRANVVVMRIKALDQDLVGSDNWLAVFTIEAGNEAGYFSITTDPKTNEASSLFLKPLDYEEVKELHLKVLVSNKAEYHISTTEVQQKTYTVKIKVKNQPEGPMFRPRVKAVNITEGIKTLIHTVIATYPAVDGDTFETVKNVRYVKGRDPDNWLKINEKTAEITLNKLPDRESKHLKNGTYYAEIICMTADVPSQTATGTVAIMVEDTNDHCPELVQTLQSVCTDKSILYITAHDADPEPNGPPFEFTVVSADDSAAWGVEHINDTTALLRAHKPLWPGSYQLAVNVRDQQGKSCEHSQPVNFHVCTCKEDGTCSWQGKPKAVFGAPGVSFLLLGLLLLLLVPLLLLFCACWNHGVSGFVDIPFDPVPPLSSGNTEEKGEDKVSGAHFSMMLYLMSQAIDASLHFQEEGSDSPVGSLGCCSLIEGDNDLEFLNDLGLKFKTLAEICSGTVLEVSSSSMLPGATLRPASQPSPAPSLTQAEISGFEASHAGMSGTTHSVTTTLVEQICDSGVVHPAAVRHPVDVSKQTYILQPQSVLVVEPQVHPTVMLSQVPSVYVLSDTPAPLAHGTLSHGEKVLLVEKMAAESDHGLLQDRGVSASQNFLLMERQVGPAVPINRSFLKKMETQKVVGVSGAQQEVGLSGSPSLMLEEHQRVLHEAQSAQSQSMGRVVSGSSSEGLGLNSSPLHDSVLSGARKVLMQEKKVSIMERSLQGNATG
uniref:Desmoglein-2-like n=1 Tax=Scleropages formosus TaxID=113540 RepID=A0A8C9VYY3_SCLFO